MKKNLFWMLAAAVAVLFSFPACSDDDGGSTSIVGTWTYVSETPKTVTATPDETVTIIEAAIAGNSEGWTESYTFNSDGTGVYTDNLGDTEPFTYIYSVTAGTLTTTRGGETITQSVAVNGNKWYVYEDQTAYFSDPDTMAELDMPEGSTVALVVVTYTYERQ